MLYQINNEIAYADIWYAELNENFNSSISLSLLLVYFLFPLKHCNTFYNPIRICNKWI